MEVTAGLEAESGGVARDGERIANAKTSAGAPAGFDLGPSATIKRSTERSKRAPRTIQNAADESPKSKARDNTKNREAQIRFRQRQKLKLDEFKGLTSSVAAKDTQIATLQRQLQSAAKVLESNRQTYKDLYGHDVTRQSLLHQDLTMAKLQAQVVELEGKIAQGDSDLSRVQLDNTNLQKDNAHINNELLRVDQVKNDLRAQIEDEKISQRQVAELLGIQTEHQSPTNTARETAAAESLPLSKFEDDPEAFRGWLNQEDVAGPSLKRARLDSAAEGDPLKSLPSLDRSDSKEISVNENPPDVFDLTWHGSDGNSPKSDYLIG